MQSRPSPTPQQVDLLRAWRNARPLPIELPLDRQPVVIPVDYVRIPNEVAPTMLLARLIDVSDRTIRYWRSGRHRPRPRHRRKLMALQAVIRRAR